MIEIRLVKDKSFGVENWYLKKFLIVDNNIKVGRLSMVEFQIEEPFLLNWEYLNEIYVEPEYRQQGIAKNTMKQIGDVLTRKSYNGILENAVSVNGAKKIYDDLGWLRLKYDNSWQIFKKIPVSEFVVRKTQEFVLKNQIRWQASSLN